ncbi:Histone chaperone asf1 [Mycoemilia scoparia]|uniref:Histone chaperone n=1 Tax=Mycoemilia scoparia TaxID=417184 RepID=A0A9W7ZX89_9FUNG|nr:Histone chaperone asf1 [Mycoemilia scoparia]
MSVVNISNINILNNPVHFLEPYQLEITFECISELKDDLEFELIYVGSADNTKLDQKLDSLLVGPVPVGVNRFLFEADPPNIEKIPKEDLLGVTVILLTCSYKGKEFVRIGYYVNNEYQDEELKLNPPEKPELSKIYRNILAKKPRVTRFPINWENPEKEEEPPKQDNVDENEDSLAPGEKGAETTEDSIISNTKNGKGKMGDETIGIDDEEEEDGDDDAEEDLGEEDLDDEDDDDEEEEEDLSGSDEIESDDEASTSNSKKRKAESQNSVSKQAKVEK